MIVYCIHTLGGVLIFCFFFFKQKTAYEMVRSDWSSDVCSSDLGELRFAKAERAFVLIDQLRSAKEAHVNGIEIGVRNVPQFDRAEVVEVDGVRHWFGGGFGGRDSLCALGQDMLAIAEFHFEHERFARCFEMLEEAIYVESRMRGENVFGLGENVFNERAGDDSQGNFAIDAAESEVVDLMAERRDVRA